ncbi:uncharacterized membrane-anchored protein YhcB (DUF1043 family) [Aminobacter niigataensis]|uniref:Uncharacterized membrane-anchored protein YhcB (DUF1043 family) n=1 Tax=Aminobacter niigataensis TaxID=83265 RepID=A0ABR6KXM3_9HYPH|nr:hypothetical protein [Aminobacter niigataensis]MBB4649269.1 uncharacterized membrane-anchored protein YhcB (DUF1043 family) [Aminobacter niigataensis]
MSWPLVLMLCAAGSIAFLIGIAVGTVIYALPRPRLFGFEVRNDD